ncbi:carotenoid oxygenase family protein [Streptomyces sp. NPDC047081]|uniref:carotenoid oxygenase family protein n=1 Tax=Streptomyces sp. NPDC047081 TaxID=3154706 RepID=UPI0033FC3A0D
MLGFTTMEEEVRHDSLPIEGAVPEWLTGRLIRVTPALLDWKSPTGTKSMGHWFDGLAMINCFSFGAGKVAYASRFLRTHAYRSIRERGVLGEPATMGTDPCRIMGKRIMAMFDPKQTDNTNINVARIGEKYLALTEVPLPVEFDPDTLETYGQVKMESDVAGQLGPVAHPHFDRDSGDMIAYFTNMGPRPTYRVHAWAPGTTTRREIARVPTNGTPRYMHSFAMTERYMVLTAQPMTFSAAALARTGRGVDALKWDPDGSTEFIVVDRHSGHVVGRFEGEPFFFFHHCNAYEDGDDIVVDVVAMNDAASVWSLKLDRLRDPEHKPRFYGELRRYRIRPSRRRVSVETLSEAHLEFPRINYALANARDYRFAYGTAYRTPDSSWFDELVKIDVTTGGDVRWSRDHCFPGEPVYVQKPGADGEDSGVVLSVVLDAKAGSSFLLILDATTFDELGRVQAPHHIGFNTHGDYFD